MLGRFARVEGYAAVHGDAILTDTIRRRRKDAIKAIEATDGKPWAELRERAIRNLRIEKVVVIVVSANGKASK